MRTLPLLLLFLASCGPQAIRQSSAATAPPPAVAPQDTPARTDDDCAALRLQLEECRFGADSVLGTLWMLPETPTLDEAEKRAVVAFLERFPVRLVAGEAALIARHRSPTGDTQAEIITMLGQARVLASMDPEARASMDSWEFKELFGRLGR